MVTMDRLPSVRRTMRRELDRLAGEILRRDAETDVCLALYARRARLLFTYSAHVGWCRELRELLR